MDVGKLLTQLRERLLAAEEVAYQLERLHRDYPRPSGVGGFGTQLAHQRYIDRARVISRWKKTIEVMENS